MPNPLKFEVLLVAALIKMVVMLGITMLLVPMLVLLERKLIADFQARIGPNRVGPFGLLQTIADGIKLVAKEDILPATVDRLLYFAGPVVSMIPALSVMAVIPFGGDLDVGGHRHRLVIADMPVGVLFILALTSLSVYGIVLSGWSSNNKYSLLGGLRSSAQMVSYELPMGLCVVAALMIASSHNPVGLFTLSLSTVVDAQDGGIWNWTAFNFRFGFLGMVAAVMFYICGLAETNRAPFDLPEAETELIGGYHTEYGGLRWAMFFMGEYAAMLNVSAITTSLYFGGWHAPYPEPFAAGSLLSALHGVFWYCAKVIGIIVLYIWIRATLPRLRYDRLMGFGWKVMIPAGLAMVLMIATILSVAHAEPVPAVLRTAQEKADEKAQRAPLSAPAGKAAGGRADPPGAGKAPANAPAGKAAPPSAPAPANAPAGKAAGADKGKGN